MDFNAEEYMKLMSKPPKKMIVMTVVLLVGIVLTFISFFIKSLAFLYFLIPGVILILTFLIDLGISKYKIDHRYQTKKEKIKKCKATVCEDNKEKVICQCPHCNKNIRLPNKKGKHGVDCPICRRYFEVKI